MNIGMIEAAAQRLEGHAVETPLLNAPLLDAVAGRRIFVKAECLQKTGSFKYRGGRASISALRPEERARGVVAFSSGNHAQGIALAARELEVPAVIVMPSDAPAVKIGNTRTYGAEVVLYDRETEDRFEIARRFTEGRGLVLIPPFDHPEVIAGQGTVGLELGRQAATAGLTEADVLVCCGGGGLTAGMALALADRAPGLRVRPVEPQGFDDVGRSLAAGSIQTNNRRGGSLCDAILTPAPGALTFPVMQAHCGPGITVGDGEALRAMALAYTHLRIVLEPGGAVSLAAALWHREDDADVIAVVTGGNVDAAVFRRALDTTGDGP